MSRSKWQKWKPNQAVIRYQAPERRWLAEAADENEQRAPNNDLS